MGNESLAAADQEEQAEVSGEPTGDIEDGRGDIEDGRAQGEQEDDAARGEVDAEEARRPRVVRDPGQPSEEERAEHDTTHIP